jgi:mannose/fructose/N-acetylgalactosamine-specific phosphotransferase system component IIC
MNWVVGVGLYFLIGLVSAVILAKVDAADTDGSSEEIEELLMIVFFGWPMFVVVIAAMGSMMGIMKGITWLAKTIPDVKFTAKEK